MFRRKLASIIRGRLCIGGRKDLTGKCMVRKWFVVLYWITMTVLMQVGMSMMIIDSVWPRIVYVIVVQRPVNV